MGMDYSAYVGPYLKMERTQINEKKTRQVCSKCGTVYKNDAKFCSKDGSEIVKELYSESCDIRSYFQLCQLYDEMQTSKMYDAFDTPEYLMDKTHFVCKPNTSIGIDISEESIFRPITSDMIDTFIKKFKSEYTEELSILDSLGIKYTIEFGILGYWG